VQQQHPRLLRAQHSPARRLRAQLLHRLVLDTLPLVRPHLNPPQLALRVPPRQLQARPHNRQALKVHSHRLPARLLNLPVLKALPHLFQAQQLSRLPSNTRHHLRRYLRLNSV
jgi:hypothetical protein